MYKDAYFFSLKNLKKETYKKNNDNSILQFSKKQTIVNYSIDHQSWLKHLIDCPYLVHSLHHLWWTLKLRRVWVTGLLHLQKPSGLEVLPARLLRKNQFKEKGTCLGKMDDGNVMQYRSLYRQRYSVQQTLPNETLPVGKIHPFSKTP